jgi:hypothetical protein
MLEQAVPTPEFAASFGCLAATHLWQSTGFAAVAALLALALRANQARARYWLWLHVPEAGSVRNQRRQ